MPFKLSDKQKGLLIMVILAIIFILPVILLIAHYAGGDFLGESTLLNIWIWIAVDVLILISLLPK